jgi:hypothetical protein
MLKASQQTRATLSRRFKRGKISTNESNSIGTLPAWQIHSELQPRRLSCWKHLSKGEQHYWDASSVTNSFCTTTSSNCHAGSISANESNSIETLPAWQIVREKKTKRATASGRFQRDKFTLHYNRLQLSCWKHFSKREQHYWDASSVTNSTWKKTKRAIVLRHFQRDKQYAKKNEESNSISALLAWQIVLKIQLNLF